MKVVTSTRVSKADFAPEAKFRTVSSEARVTPTRTPTTGTPRRSTVKTAGNSPSLAAAQGAWAESRVQPLSAPVIETRAATATAVPPQEPPKTVFTASEKGAVEWISRSWATVPNTASVPSR